jgi:hypothetical protein
MKEENELIVVEENSVSVIFKKGGSQAILDKIKEEVKKFVPDVSTAKGRKEIISMASKVSKSKTLLEWHGKKLVEGIKAQAKVIDIERKTIRDELDVLRDEVRKPVTDWENAEKKRVADIEARIYTISRYGDPYLVDSYESSVRVGIDLADLKRIVIDATFEEFELEANKVKQNSMMLLEAKLITLQNAEKEKAEAERLEKERLEKEQKEREERIAQEAAEKAKREAEEKARKEAEEKERKEKEERDRLEKEKLEAQLATEKAEREKKEAIERAEREKQEAIEAERKRQEEEKRREKEEEEKRQANKRHRNKIVNEILDDLTNNSFPKTEMRWLVDCIIEGKIRHLKIEF